MKKIQLTKNKFALVDNEDYEWINQFKWYFSDTGYAVKRVWINKDWKNPIFKTIRMHRLINNTPTGFETDHINRNKLDNGRANLRTASHAQNTINANIRNDNTSGFKGVYWNKEHKKYSVRIVSNKKLLHLGYFSDFKEAIQARKEAEKIYYKEFAYK